MISPSTLARQRGEQWRRHRKTGLKPGPRAVGPCPVPGCTNQISAENATGVCSRCQIAGPRTMRKLLDVIEGLRGERAA